MKRSLTFGSLFLALATVGTAQTVKTIVNNGKSSNRYDIVILGDGYQAAEQGLFDSNAQAVVTKLFATEPYKSYESYFNVHTVFRASQDSGADHPDRNPPIVKNTVYDASYNVGGTGRCLYIRNTSAAWRDAALAPATEGRVMVIVNDSRYGGCAGTFAVTYNGGSMTNVQVHEFGHSFGSLADEYDYPNNQYTGSEPSQKNVTKNSSGAKWSKWLGFNGVSAFEGARYYRLGLFRPKSNCIMRSLGQPVCPVCGEQIVISAYKTVSALEDPLPRATSATVARGARLTYSFTNIAPGSANAKVTWRVDANVQTVTGTQFILDTTNLSVGAHVITAEVLDRTTFVRNDPNGELKSTHSWNLTVQASPIADLIPTNGQASLAAAGGTAQVLSVTRNDGTAASPSFQVEHFLSQDPVLSPATDVYLGGYTQSGLGIGQEASHTRPTVQIPAHLVAAPYYLLVVVDRANAVPESNENNNLFVARMFVGAAGCGPALSYDDPLVYPATANGLVGTAGGTVHPVVTAPCSAGDVYVILLGCTGTQPGTVLGPGLTLPLNVDACSNVFFRASQTSTLVTGFVGTLNGAGYGRARITLPPGVVSGSLSGHFAAVLLRNGAFREVSNPVKFDFR